MGILIKNGRVITAVDDYFADVAAGKLANVVMIDPPFRGENRADDHPQGDIRTGQRFVREVFRAFAESPHLEKGAFILVYDEWGGFFDHVAPPKVPDDRESANLDEDFGQTGFRTPAVAISPYARRGSVEHGGVPVLRGNASIGEIAQGLQRVAEPRVPFLLDGQ